MLRCCPISNSEASGFQFLDLRGYVNSGFLVLHSLKKEDSPWYADLTRSVASTVITNVRTKCNNVHIFWFFFKRDAAVT